VGEHNEFMGVLAGRLAEKVLALLERAVVAMERTADAQREVALEMDKHNALYLLSERAKQEDHRG